MKRKVRWWDYIWNKELNKSEKIEKGEAVFHQWGIDCVKSDLNIGSYSTAIIEIEDGTIENVPATNIRFIDNCVDDKKTLYGVVVWVYSRPVLDGMNYFLTRESAVEYTKQCKMCGMANGQRVDENDISIDYTIIRLEKGLC